MKQLKMLGLAAGAALALAAPIGAGTASATTLFRDSGKTAHYASGTEIQVSLTQGSSSILTGPAGEALNTCASSTIAGKTSATSAMQVSGSISSLT
jgi:hypothetical protein